MFNNPKFNQPKQQDDIPDELEQIPFKDTLINITDE